MDKKFEKISDKGLAHITKETRDAVKPAVKELVRKLTEDHKFKREDIIPAIKRGLDDAKNDV